jgi:hypothetical protein
MGLNKGKIIVAGCRYCKGMVFVRQKSNPNTTNNAENKEPRESVSQYYFPLRLVIDVHIIEQIYEGEMQDKKVEVVTFR